MALSLQNIDTHRVSPATLSHTEIYRHILLPDRPIIILNPITRDICIQYIGQTCTLFSIWDLGFFDGISEGEIYYTQRGLKIWGGGRGRGVWCEGEYNGIIYLAHIVFRVFFNIAIRHAIFIFGHIVIIEQAIEEISVVFIDPENCFGHSRWPWWCHAPYIFHHYLFVWIQKNHCIFEKCRICGAKSMLAKLQREYEIQKETVANTNRKSEKWPFAFWKFSLYRKRHFSVHFVFAFNRNGSFWENWRTTQTKYHKEKGNNSVSRKRFSISAERSGDEHWRRLDYKLMRNRNIFAVSFIQIEKWPLKLQH